jgi:hypothetical protein
MQALQEPLRGQAAMYSVEGPNESAVVYVYMTVAGLFMIGAGGSGGLLRRGLFVSTGRWPLQTKPPKRLGERAVRSPSGRFVGIFMLAFGCVILWLCTRRFARSSRLKDVAAFGIGCTLRHVTPEAVLRSNLGSCAGTC